MIQLIKADFFKLWKLGITKICIILNVVIAIAITLGTSFFVKMYMVAGETFEGISGISTWTQCLQWSVIIAILQVICVSLFSTSGFANKTHKNPVTKGYSRTDVYISGLITVSCFAVIMLVSYVFVSTLMASILWGLGNYTLDMISGSMMVVGIQALLHISLASLMYMVAMILKGVGETIACNLLILTVFANLICNLINRFIENIDSSLYWLINNMLFLTNPMPSTVDVARSVMVGVGFLLFSTIFGILGFRKYEFK